MAAGPPVLLGLRDAAMAGPCRGGGQGPPWATNKLGGSADWVPAVRPGCPRCGVCGRALAHLVQVYCPLDGSPFHRLANVFACAWKGCWGEPRSWKVLRSQCSQAQQQETQDCGVKQKQESNFTAKDWCDEADDWGVCDGAESPVCSSLQLLGLNEAVSSSSSREVECASQFQQLRLSEAMDTSGSLHTHPPASEGMVMETSSSAPVFQPFYISVVDEEDYTGCLDTEHADQLLKEYQQREGVDLQQLMSESFANEGDNEKYEKSQVKSRDHTFHKFMKRISVCHEQILRFNLRAATFPKEKLILNESITKSSDRELFIVPDNTPGFHGSYKASVFDCFVPEPSAAHLLKLSQCSDRNFVYQLSRTRYSWGGQPLFITCPPANINKGVPACGNCGSNRIFEFQLMPALVTMLQSDSGLSVEFGTAIVYTCERSCWPSDHQTPLEEFIFVQEDPDQKLFK